MSERPIFHVLAGPNGAGKTTLYRTEIAPRFPDAEFVNADELATARYGHPAVTLEESQTGQRLAEERRRELMAQGKSLVTESTFSHPSKVELIQDAIKAGYEVRLYHVNVRSPELSVKRVDRRVKEGGHPVPEDKIRERYTRNQALIREASRQADRTHVFDNSHFGQPPERVLSLAKGQARYVSERMPAWARNLYAEELRTYAPERLNRPAASYAKAQAMTRAVLGEAALTRIARGKPGEIYSGEIIAETDLHIVQAVDEKTAVAHIKTRLQQVPTVGAQTSIAYGPAGVAQPAPAKASQARPERAIAFAALPADQAQAKHPELADAYQRLQIEAARQRLRHPDDAETASRNVEQQRVAIGRRLDAGLDVRLSPAEREHLQAAQAFAGAKPSEAVRAHPRLAGPYAALGAYSAALKEQGIDQAQRQEAMQRMRAALADRVLTGQYRSVQTQQMKFRSREASDEAADEYGPSP